MWSKNQETMERLWQEGRIKTGRDGKPRLDGLIEYLDEKKGMPVQDWWDDIGLRIGNTSRERLGYPTQKPVALLERIIEASSNEGDIVFDPFCGCATTLVAADRLERQWAGIDLSPLAVKLVNERITDRPRRASPKIAGRSGAAPMSSISRRAAPTWATCPTIAPIGIGSMASRKVICAGCETHFPFKVMEVDHILPQSRGGTDHGDNLQLLCTHCNKSKGSKTMAEWRASQSA